MKYKNLSEEEQEDFDSLTQITHKPKGSKKADIYGLCSTCKYFNLVKSEFKVLYSSCDMKEKVKITEEEPIKFCSMYSKIGEMSLYEMGQLALFLNIDKDKERVGFLNAD